MLVDVFRIFENFSDFTISMSQFQIRTNLVVDGLVSCKIGSLVKYLNT